MTESSFDVHFHLLEDEHLVGNDGPPADARLHFDFLQCQVQSEAEDAVESPSHPEGRFNGR